MSRDTRSRFVKAIDPSPIECAAHAVDEGPAIVESTWPLDFIHAVLELAHTYTVHSGRWIVPLHISMAQTNILLLLNKCSPLTPSDLAKSLGFTRASVGRVIRVLVLMGLVSCAEDPHDKRAMSLRLTDSGRELANHVLLVSSRVCRSILDDIDDHDGAALVALVKAATLKTKKLPMAETISLFAELVQR